MPILYKEEEAGSLRSDKRRLHAKLVSKKRSIEIWQYACIKQPNIKQIERYVAVNEAGNLKKVAQLLTSQTDCQLDFNVLVWIPSHDMGI